jgi:NADPH:quinone reductase-like Zn-dependent oxidoreductase
MKAVSCLSGELSVVEIPSPQPARGQLLLDVRQMRYLRVGSARQGSRG